ncbi:C40 family peptidase [Streptomyces yaizuensis]|uniref:C40 family peptidase n=1 Tax=Streptomyces yaizuensis TaxID=2989713 RepID=A0ABQ5NW72_9ACTN|nr:C40 family peptidase [Streptomyces sp. YSPA8]GLF94630.1 C40 family peptidase [Streptomyces sp. YSPA8]
MVSAGRTRRHTAGTAALAAVTALALTGPPGEARPRLAPAAHTRAPAAPVPPPDAAVLPVLPEAPATLPDALTRLRILYHQAEDAGSEYEGAARRLRAQRARTARLGRQLTRAREALGASRVAAGHLAREQYQGHAELSGLSALLRLLLARDPGRAVDEQYLIERAAAHRRATLHRLEGTARRAEVLSRSARRALERERTLAARQKRARDTAAVRLRAVEELLASLTPDQIAGVSAPGVRDTVLPAGTLTRDHPPTRAGALALRYAVAQIGKPYLWGAEGPGSFDCSGLTQRAWAAAGVRIPRTSQEQWARLPRVPLRSLRPGDLVVYFGGATHVGIYLGGGRVVHAPRPGTAVKVSPVAANPPLGAVRPDPYGPPLPPGAYLPPPLPEGATAGPDTGWSGGAVPLAQEAAGTASDASSAVS